MVSVRRALVGVSLGMAAAMAASAQPPGLALRLDTTHTRVAPGGTLRVRIGAVNQGAPVAMDVYCVVVLPDGQTLLALGGGFGHLSRLAQVSPLVAGVTLPTGFAASLDDFFVYTFTGAEPIGTYRFYMAAVRPGALRDGRIDGGDVLAVALQQVTLGPPLTTAIDTAQAGAGTVTTASGGSVQATAADGTVYTLAVPAGAVAATTTVRLTPVTGVAGVNPPISVLAGVQIEPDGLVLARPARLTIDVPAGVPAAAVAALHISDGGTRGELVPSASGATRLVVEVSHFSAIAVPRTAAELLAAFGQSGSFGPAVNLLTTATVTGAPADVQALRDHLVRWYDDVAVLLQTGQGDTDALLAGLAELSQWDRLRIEMEVLFGAVDIGGTAIRGQLTGRAALGRTLAVTGLAQAFTRANDACRVTPGSVSARLGAAERAGIVGVLAFDYFNALEAAQAVSPTATQVPTPDLAANGLGLDATSTRLCVRMRIDDVVVPTLAPGATGTLTVASAVSFDGGPSEPSNRLEAFFQPDPMAAGSAVVQRTDAAGRASFPVTATAGGAVRYRVCSNVHPADFTALYLLTLLQNVCRTSSGGVVVTPPQTQIAPGDRRQFTAAVQDTSDQRVTWTVNGGGTITSSGLFTSNGTLGTFFVTATSVADPSAVGVAQITVTAPSPFCPTGCVYDGTFVGSPTPVTLVIGPPDPNNPAGRIATVAQGGPNFLNYVVTLTNPNSDSSGFAGSAIQDPVFSIQGTATPTVADFTHFRNGQPVGSFTGTRRRP